MKMFYWTKKRNYWIEIMLLALFLNGTSAYVCPKPDGKFPKQGNHCKTYYLCSGGHFTEETCGSGQNFNPEIEDCDWEELSPCSKKPQWTECPLPYGYFIKNGTNCKNYYSCANGIPTELQCPGDLIFDPSKESCEWPELYTCIDEIRTTTRVPSSQNTTNAMTSSIQPFHSTRNLTSKIPTSSEKTEKYSTRDYFTTSNIIAKTGPPLTFRPTAITKNVTGDIWCPKPFGIFPHPYDKHKFVGCVNNKPVILNCPENLVYNDKMKACNYE